MSAKGCCSVSGCDRAVNCRGWCKKHYTRWRRHGDPLFLVDRHKPMTGPDDPRHGTVNGYQNQHCRCDRCKEAWTVDYRTRYGKRSLAEWRAIQRANIKHGANAYSKGRCRCEVCRKAASARRSEARQRARERQQAQERAA